jgi:SAM-dependent methyltransferase
MPKTIFENCRRILRPFVGYARHHPLVTFFTGEGHPQWGRIIMDKATQDLVGALSYKEFETLEISGNQWKDFGFKSYQQARYPEYDICKSPPVGSYDLIIAEQVFEHLLWPYRAVRNVFAMLRPGGYFLITTPFLVRIHDHPVDCTRWSEVGLKHFLAEGGFPLDRMQTGSWGNQACVKANLNKKSKWIGYCSWRHSLENEPVFPLHVWALALRPKWTD